jgi:hypothetical protein
MRKWTCVLGRHDWRPRVNREGQPYEECGKCGRYRYPDAGGSPFDRPDQPPMNPEAGTGTGWSSF